MKIKCDFHIHSEHSVDGVMKTSEIIEIAKKCGFSAIAIADHNTAAGWREAAALTAGDKDFLIVPAIEYATEKGHIIALFIKDELGSAYLKPIDDFHYEFDDVVKGIKAAGGMAVFAHPFKENGRPRGSYDIFDNIDAIEVLNGRAACKFNGSANIFALEAAKELELPFSCGSDSHTSWEIGNAVLELEVSELTQDEVRRAFTEGKGSAYGKDAYALHCAVSAWNKQLKKKKFRRIPKQIAYLGAMAALDMLKAARVLKKNRYRCYIREGSYDIFDKNSKKDQGIT